MELLKHRKLKRLLKRMFPNRIIKVTDNDLTLYSGGGWFTNTTKSRLNALIQEFSFKGAIFQKNFNWYVKMFKTVTPFHEGITLPII